MSLGDEGEKKIIERIRKLQELADRGEYGERINAREMIDELMEKYHISPDQLNEEECCSYVFKAKTGWQRRLMHQLVALMGEDRVKLRFDIVPKVYTVKGKKKYGHGVAESIVCTPLDWVDLATRYEILKRDYARQLDTFYVAFLKRNELMLPFDPNAPQLTQKEIEEDERSSLMAWGVERSVLNKQIEHVN